MYEFDTKVEFEEVWTKLIANYNVQENNWINSICPKRKMGFLLHEGSIHTWDAKYSNK